MRLPFDCIEDGWDLSFFVIVLIILIAILCIWG
jgi:hypothetical protein